METVFLDRRNAKRVFGFHAKEGGFFATATADWDLVYYCDEKTGAAWILRIDKEDKKELSRVNASQVYEIIWEN